MAEESPSQRNIPLPIQREVRQRCGFGCVICGIPLYEYDHVLGWANVKRHCAEEITLLCDRHHREKTSSLLPNGDIVTANKNPYNRRFEVSKPYDLHYAGDSCEIVMGNMSFTASDKGNDGIVVPISIDNDPLLGFVMTDQHLLLNLNLFDVYNQLILRIRNNELLYSTSPWDIELKGRNLVVREAAREILVDIVFEVPNRIIIRRARLMRNGVEVLIDGNGLTICEENVSSGFSNFRIQAPYGIIIGPHPENISATFKKSEVSRYSQSSGNRSKWLRSVFKKNKKT